MEKIAVFAATNSLGQVAGAAFLATTVLAGTIAGPLSAQAKNSSPRIALAGTSDKGQKRPAGAGSGALIAMSSDGAEVGRCPLRHTSVTAQVSGYVAKVKVTQVFENTYKEPIEAIYTFPLSSNGAVDDMVMQIGKRKIVGTIKKRDEAKEIYDQAKSQGRIASLLDQERTNIFTQSVANIPPGEKVEVTLSYVETLPYEAGKFSFVFPTVVGPRFIPGTPSGKTGSGRESDTDKVPDASRITPPVSEAGTRSGHDISLSVNVDAGMPISNVSSKLHNVNIEKNGPSSVFVSLKDDDTIPNKDFVLTWDVAGSALKSGYLTHKSPTEKSGYFTLMLVPPKRVETSQVAPKEMIFLIDCSGSQSGAPLEKAKETLSYIIEHMNPQDTFQIIAFSSSCSTLFPKPQAVSAAMKKKAQQFIDALSASGGTWMAPAVEAACKVPADEHRLRIVTFMTDGFVGNDQEIVGMIRRLRDSSRWFSFGTGNGVNHALIDGIAQEGGGEADYVLLNTSGAEVGRKFYQHISTPVLTDVKVDFGDLAVKEVFPKEVADVWAERPLYFKGRYEHAGKGTVTLSGFAGGKAYKERLEVNLPDLSEGNAALSSMWARAKVDRLMREEYIGAQNGSMKKELQDEIVDTALKHHIMTQFTSFVAVDESTSGKKGSKTVVVPTELPDGVSREMAYGSVSGGGAGRGAVVSFHRTNSSQMKAKRGEVANKPVSNMRFNGSRQQISFVECSPTVTDYRASRPLGASLAIAPSVPKPSPSSSVSSPVSLPIGIDHQLEETTKNHAAPHRMPHPTSLPTAPNVVKSALNPTAAPVPAEGALKSKMSEYLTRLIRAAGSNSKSELSVAIELTDLNDELIAKLKRAGLKNLTTDVAKKRVMAAVTVHDLRVIVQLSEVVSVRESSELSGD